MSRAVAATRIRAGFYLDSVALMRISRTVEDTAGVSAASLMMGSPSNKELLRDAGLLDAGAEGAGPNDLVIAIRADGADALGAAFEAAEAALRGPAGGDRQGKGWNPRSLETGLRALPAANLAIVSVPGDFAAREARRALERGLNVMLFSDNVAIDDEVALKALARRARPPDDGAGLRHRHPRRCADRFCQRGAAGRYRPDRGLRHRAAGGRLPDRPGGRGDQPRDRGRRPRPRRRRGRRDDADGDRRARP